MQIPTIGIGSSKYCDGQILVLDDFGWLGYQNQCYAEQKWFEKKGYKNIFVNKIKQSNEE